MKYKITIFVSDFHYFVIYKKEFIKINYPFYTSPVLKIGLQKNFYAIKYGKYNYYQYF